MNRKAKLPFDPKVFLSKVNGGRAISDYRKDQIVFRQGDPSDAVFYIQSGKVKNTVVSEQGKEAVVALLETGDFFGEGCLAGEILRLSTVSALMKSVTARISKADITRVIHEEPALALLADERAWRRRQARSVAEEWPTSRPRALTRLNRSTWLAPVRLLTHLFRLRLLGLVIQIRLHRVFGHSFSSHG